MAGETSNLYQPKDVIGTYSGDGPAGSGLDTFMNKMPSDYSNFFSGQKSDINNFLGRYSGAIGNQETVSHMGQRIGNELNLPSLRSAADTVNTNVANLPYTYSGATRGFDVNANQLGRIVTNKGIQLAPLATSVNNRLNTAENTLGQQMGFEQTQQQKELLPYQSEQSLLNDRLAREATGFQTQEEDRLQGYITKMQQGVVLSRGEQQDAEALAAAKLSYDAAVNVAKINAQYQTLNPGQSLFNTLSGSVYHA